MEQQRSTRRYVRVLTSLDVFWPRGDKQPAAKMVSLSIDGCLIETRRRAVVGRLISFETELPAGGRLALEGRVIYQRDPLGFGVLFTQLSEGQRNSLTTVIEDASKSCVLPDNHGGLIAG